MNVHMHIGRLVLNGIDIDPAQSTTVRSAVEAELIRLVTRGGFCDALLAGGDSNIISAANTIRLNEGDTARLGQLIARAVYGEIGN